MVVYLGGERKGKETKGDEMGEEGREGREGRKERGGGDSLRGDDGSERDRETDRGGTSAAG